MRLVFTKLITPLKKILVDLGNGFEEVPLEELQDSTTGRYLQLSDTVVPSLIRVKVNSSEQGTFDMIREYQITDDEGNILGGSENNSIKFTKVYAWFHYHYKSSVYTFTRNPKVGDMAFYSDQNSTSTSFIRINNVNTDDSGNVSSIETNLLFYTYYGEAMMFDGYSTRETNSYPQGFFNVDNGPKQVNLTFSKADMKSTANVNENEWHIEIDDGLLTYAEADLPFYKGRKIFITNNNVVVGDFISFDNVTESLDIIDRSLVNSEDSYYFFYGNIDTLPRTLQLISGILTNDQGTIIIDGTCIINLTITE